MPFIVPNLPDAAYFDQSEPDAGDFRALGERATGVLTGCLVAAQGTPALAVDCAAGTYLINGTPYSKSSGSVTIVAGESNARFDLICGDTNGVTVVIKGTASSNPSFPVADPLSYCLFSAVYVRQSVSAVQITDVVDKRISAPADFKRVYTSSTTVAISLTDAVPKTTSIRSDGQITWVSNVLRRTADAAMEFATSLVLKAADTSLVNLILQGRTTSPGTINVLEVQAYNSSTALASISGTGVATFDNFKHGMGSPEGAVLGNRGDLYVDLSFSDPNAALWIKSDSGDNTGWKPMQQHDTSASVFPVGTIIAIPCDPASYTPAGFVYCNGAQYSATDPTYTALYAKYGVQFGGSVGVNFKVPDYRGYSLAGSGGGLGLTIGQFDGLVNGLATIAVTNMPSHIHPLNDPGHRHPFYGLPYTYRQPSGPPTSLRPMFSDNPLVNLPQMPYLDVWPANWPGDQQTTGITMSPTGGGTPLDVLSPVSGVAFFAKL